MSEDNILKTHEKLLTGTEIPNPFSECENLEEVVALNKAQVEQLGEEMRSHLWGTNNERLLEKLLAFSDLIKGLTAVTVEQLEYLDKYFTRPLCKDRKLRYELDNFPPTNIEWHRFLYAKNNPDILEALKKISGFSE
jgi:hypothetical protein